MAPPPRDPEPRVDATSSGDAARNVDPATVQGFGEEWTRFDQGQLSTEEWETLFDQYFHLVPWHSLPPGADGFDMGCGSGRWARGVAPRLGRLHVIDASAAALAVARRNLAAHPNCVFHHAAVDALPLAPSSMDFGYSLGVLHHIPDTAAGLRHCVACLKPGAPFLLYLYYALDNQPAWYRALWRVSDTMRHAIARLPTGVRHVVSDLLAAGVYWPLARFAAFAARRGLDVRSFPLAFYRDRSFYTMRTDALDRFGTRLERRFRRDELQALMESAGLERIRFSERAPFWCAMGYRRAAEDARV